MLGILRFWFLATVTTSGLIPAVVGAFLFAAWPTAAGLRGLAIEDAVWCGVCHPRPDPIPVDFLDAPPRELR